MNNLFNTNDVNIVVHDLRDGALSVSANLSTRSEGLRPAAKLMGVHVTSLKVRAHVDVQSTGKVKRTVHLYVHQNLGQRDPHMSASFAKGVDGLVDKLAQRGAGKGPGLQLFTAALAEAPETLAAVTAAAEEAFAQLAALPHKARVLRYLDMVEAKLPNRTQAQRDAARRTLTSLLEGRGPSWVHGTPLSELPRIAMHTLTYAACCVCARR